jgi:hypothetical protein
MKVVFLKKLIIYIMNRINSNYNHQKSNINNQYFFIQIIKYYSFFSFLVI